MPIKKLLGRIIGKSPSAYVIPGLTNMPSWSEYTMSAAVEALSEHYNIPVKCIKGKSRKDNLVYVRHLFCYWMYRNYNKYTSLKDIGVFLDGRDHTTIINSIAIFQGWLDVDLEFKKPLPTGHLFVREDYSETLKYISLCLSITTSS